MPTEGKQDPTYRKLLEEIDKELDMIEGRLKEVLESDADTKETPTEGYGVELLNELNRVKGRVVSLNDRIRL